MPGVGFICSPDTAQAPQTQRGDPGASHLDVLDIQPQPQLFRKDLSLCWAVIPNAHLPALTPSAQKCSEHGI